MIIKPLTQRLVFVLLLFLLLSTGYLITSKFIFHSSFPSAEKAIKIATKYTPLKKLESSHITPPGPVVLALLGRDSNNRELAVFINKKSEIEGYEYLLNGITLEKAIEIACKIHRFDGNPKIILGWTGSKPYWFIQGSYDKEIIILSLDFYTGNELGK